MSFKFASWVRALMKGMGHRYIKRIPYMTPKGRRYRYIYRVDHTHQGKHAFHEDHIIQGTKFALSTEDGAEFHGHIESVDGDKVEYVIDDGPQKGAVVETTKQELAAKLNEVHGVSDKLADARDKASADLEQVKQSGGSEKQIARARRRLLALGGAEDKEELEVAESQKDAEDRPVAEVVADKVLRNALKRELYYHDYFSLGEHRPEMQERLESEILDLVKRKLLPRLKEGGVDVREDDSTLKYFAFVFANSLKSRTSREDVTEADYQETATQVFFEKLPLLYTSDSEEEKYQLPPSVVVAFDNLDLELSPTQAQATGMNDLPPTALVERMETLKGRGLSTKDVVSGSKTPLTKDGEGTYNLGDLGTLKFSFQGTRLHYEIVDAKGQRSAARALNYWKPLRNVDRKEVPRAVMSAVLSGGQVPRTKEDTQRELAMLWGMKKADKVIAADSKLAEIEDQQYVQSPVDAAVSSGFGNPTVQDLEDLSASDRKAMFALGEDGRYSGAIYQRDGYVFATDGRQVAFRVAESGSEGRITNTGGLAASAPLITAVLSERSPSFSLDRGGIRHLRRALKINPSAQVDISVENGAYTLSMQGRKVGQFPRHIGDELSEREVVTIRAEFLSNALKHAKETATLHLSGKDKPVTTTTDSGLHSMFMPMRRAT